MAFVRLSPVSLIDTNIIGIVKSTSLPPTSVPTAWNLKRARSAGLGLVITSTQNDLVPGAT